MTPVFFTRQDSIYKELGCDCYDIDRDSRTYTGTTAGIHHPPCRAWGKLRQFAKPRPDEKNLARWSISQIRKNGGVLEHPAGSKLWEDQNLPLRKPKFDKYGGFTISIQQKWFGHRAKKWTWLYFVGLTPKQLPALELNFDALQFCVSCCRNSNLKEIPKAEREKTPKKFALWLIEVAQIIESNKR